jgi:hypothetical protein
MAHAAENQASTTSTREPRKGLTMKKRLCRQCKKRPARFEYRGLVKSDRQHDLCLECFRSARDAQQAELFSDELVPQAAELAGLVR